MLSLGDLREKSPRESRSVASVATHCDTCGERVTLGTTKEKSRSVASVARFSGEMTETDGRVVKKQQHKKLALGESASPATLPRGLRHLRQLGEYQLIQGLRRAKCRKTRCDSIATLATVGARRCGGRS